MTLRDHLAVVRRRMWFVIVPALLATGIAVGLSLAKTDMYRSSAQVLIEEPPGAATSASVTESGISTRDVRNEVLRANGSTITSRVREQVGSEPGLSAGLASGDAADVLSFTATSRSPERAAKAADTYADVYIAVRQEALTGDLEAQADVLTTQIQDLQTEIDAYADGATDQAFVQLVAQQGRLQQQLESVDASIVLVQQSGATVINTAEVPGSPYEPKPVRNGMLALVVGLLIGLGAALLVDYFDNSLRDEDDLVSAAPLPVLAVIPKLEGWKPSDTHVVTRENPAAPTAEAYRALRSALQFLRVDKRLDVVQVTSPKPGEGRSTTAANLAVTCARNGQRVVLVDCDLRRPRLHQFFGLQNDVGFTSVLMGAPLEEALQKVDGEPNLLVIASGPVPPDPSELLSGARAKSLIGVLKEGFDLVVVDSPPVLLVADSLVLSGSVDGVVLVAAAAESQRDDLAHAAQQLAGVGAPMLGTVLNAFEPKGSSAYPYRYAYGK